MGCQTLVEQRGLLGGDGQKIVVRLRGNVVPQVSDKLKLLCTGKLLDGGQVGEAHNRESLAERVNVAKKEA